MKWYKMSDFSHRRNFPVAVGAAVHSGYYREFWQKFTLPDISIKKVTSQSNHTGKRFLYEFEPRQTTTLEVKSTLETILHWEVVGYFPSISVSRNIVTDINSAKYDQLSSKLNQILDCFQIDAKNDVLCFLYSNSFLVDLLLESRIRILRYFGAGSSIILNLKNDDDMAGSILFGLIRSNIEPEKAVEMLNLFDDKWFIRVLPKTKNMLNFQLIY